MNQHATVEDFGFRDFLLVKAPREEVLAAVKSAVLETDMDLDFEAQPWKPGLFMRLIFTMLGQGGRIKEAVAETQRHADEANAAREAMGPIETDAVSMHVGDAARAVDMTMERGPAYAAAAQMHDIFQNDVRLSGIEGSDWVLIEYKEQVSGMSMLGFTLSTQLEADVLYFRQSGARVSEAKYDFHVYRGGDTARRVLCHATWAEGAREQEWWEGQSDGALTAYEDGSLYEGATDRTLLDNGKIEAILTGLGLGSGALFGGRTIDPVLFSRRSGGERIN